MKKCTFESVLSKLVCKGLAVMMIAFFAMNAVAGPYYYLNKNGYTWTYELTGYSPQTAYLRSVSPLSGDIVIPERLNDTLPFMLDSTDLKGSCPDVTSITIPSDLRFSTTYNFGCVNITNVTMYGEQYYCPTFQKSDKIKSIVWPGACLASESFSVDSKRGVTDIEVVGTSYISQRAFRGFSGAVRVAIPDGIGDIHAEAFANCLSLREIIIPASVTNLAASVFKQCYNLTTVTFEGDAPACPYPVFDMANKDLVVRVKKTSKGWDGNPNSTKLPKLWPQNNEAGRSVIHIGDPLPEPEPTVVTNYVFTTITNHVYHHDVVTDLAAYHTTVTNIHVHYVKENEKPTYILPSSYDTGFINVVAEVEGGYAVIPATWSVNYPGFTEKYGNDFSKALSKPNGKYDRHGNPMYVWQDYVAGTDPMDVNDIFDATIAIEGGQVVVSHTPELDEGRAALRKYTVYGKKNLMDSEWKVVEPGEELDYNFYRVTVKMK